jgi:hypothetical protein
VRLVEEGEKGTKGALLEDVVTALGRVTGDVTESPNCLLTDIENGGGEKLDEDGDGARLDDDLGVLGGAGRDVGQSPSCLKLRNDYRQHERREERKDAERT